MEYIYKIAVVGGTFDHFHSGHKKLLTEAFRTSEKVYVGVATSELLQTKKYKSIIESYTVRERNVKEFLTMSKYIDRAVFVPINDMYGNTLTAKEIEVIFVTDETKDVIPLINNKRGKIDFSPVQAVVVPFYLAEDGAPITSERIRKGEIDRSGYVYASHFLEKDEYILPQSIRESLRNPFGIIMNDVLDIVAYNPTILITVGDVVSLSLYKKGRQADISIIDLKTRREALSEEDTSILSSFKPLNISVNPSGTIQKESIKLIKSAVDTSLIDHQKQVLTIQGEEDLLVIPAIAFAPLKSFVLYGQYGLGIIAVEVTEEKKKEMVSLIKKFD